MFKMVKVRTYWPFLVLICWCDGLYYCQMRCNWYEVVCARMKDTLPGNTPPEMVPASRRTSSPCNRYVRVLGRLNNSSPSHHICQVYIIKHYHISGEKFELGRGFEPRTSGSLARHSTTWAILVLMPAHVQLSLLRRMPLLPGGAVMTLFAIILTTNFAFYMNMIFKSNY